MGLLLVLSLALALSCATASAETTHTYTGKSFGPLGLDAEGPLGAFVDLQGIAVDQGSQDVYAYDAGAEKGAIYKFNAAGEPADFSATATNVIKKVGEAGADEAELAVDNSAGPDAGDIYLALGPSKKVLIYSEAGTKLGELKKAEGVPWGETCGVAVDPAGDVYVAAFEAGVDKFEPTSEPGKLKYVSTLSPGEEEQSEVGEVCGLTTDAAGDVYGARYAREAAGEGRVEKWDASQFGLPEAGGTLFASPGDSLFFDPLSSDVFVDQIDAIAQYEPSGTLLGRFGESGPGALVESFGLALNDTTDDVYADDTTVVEIFGPGAVLPVVTTSSAEHVTAATAILRGSVDPDETTVTACQFEYGTSTSYGHTAPCTPPAPFSGGAAVPVSAELSGLESNTTYHYRLAASNAGGTVEGQDETLTTLLPAPAVTIAPVSQIGRESASFNGTVDPNGADATYHFEYSLDDIHWTSLPEASAGNGAVATSVMQTASGLTPGMPYHVRLVATSAGIVTGESATSSEVTFSTLSAATPRIFDIAASYVNASGATLSATIDPEGQPTSYQFEYGTTSAYGETVPATPAGPIDTPTRVAQPLSGLAPETTYHFRALASNAAGPSYGPDQTFTTGAGGELAPGSCPNETLRDESSRDPQSAVAYSLQLPDCRAYEQVTPPFKSTNSVIPGQEGPAEGEYILTKPAFSGSASTEAISTGGSPVLENSLSYLGEPPGADEEGQAAYYELARTPAGWKASSLTVAASTFPISNERLADPSDAALGLWTAGTAAQSRNAQDF
ncbi:MAG: hypothetical protein ACREHV_02920, partial [Rhizomicrobium sp.]